MSNKYFYKDIKIIKVCRVCGVSFRPPRFTHRASISLCIKHFRIQSNEAFKKRFAGLSKEEKSLLSKKRYPYWLEWKKKNIIKRNKIALESYHRRKNDSKNKARRHRRTKLKLLI